MWNYPNATAVRPEISGQQVRIPFDQLVRRQPRPPAGRPNSITEASDAAAAYPPTGSQSATYNNLNQITNLSGQILTWDLNGNLASDGQRNYAWDVENRLVSITYPGQPGKQTTFTYDGLGRRRTISSTPPGGGSVTSTSYLWCDDAICQARNASNSAIRSYYGEGEYVPGTPAQTLYYGVDQVGSVRRVFASTSSAPAYGYDAYGVPLQATAPLTDFIYGGLFYNADSGLYLAKYRPYDPLAGRWLSRDPFGEDTDTAKNLYPYVGGNPVSRVDPTGQSAVEEPSTSQNDSSSIPQMCAGNDRDAAWAKCHASCAAQTVGRGLPDAFGAYRKCMRACMNSQGFFDY
jgi:RHS repeat-associated protein